MKQQLLIFKLILIVIAFNVIGVSNSTPLKVLKLVDDASVIDLKFEKENQGLGLPVSIVRVSNNELVVASYLNLWLINEKTGRVAEVEKPDQAISWYPTGVAYSEHSKELYIANYLGKDILVLSKKHDDEFELKHMISDPEMIGPENIALSPDGKYFVVADFDNNGIILFDQKTRRKLWFTELGRAHGVAFDHTGEEIIAVGLNPPKVIRLDIEGNKIAEHVGEGWDAGEYLWPTQTALDPSTNEIWIADAHVGNIRRINSAFEELETFGANGLGTRLFNMPYGIYFDTTGELWITDTFKSRILLLNSEKEIKAIYSAPAHPSCTTGKCVGLKGDSSTEYLLGIGYQGRLDASQKFSYGFGIYSEPIKWHPGFAYTAFVSEDRSRKLALAGASPFFSSSIYYWIQALSIEKNILLYGSPEVREWIFDYQGLACPVRIDLNYWVFKDALYSDNNPVHNVENLVSACKLKVDTFIKRVANGNSVLHSYAENILDLKGGSVEERLATVFQSSEGKRFFKKLCSATNDSTRKEISYDFLKTINSMPLVFLPEVWVAKIFTSVAIEETDRTEHWNCLFSDG